LLSFFVGIYPTEFSALLLLLLLLLFFFCITFHTGYTGQRETTYHRLIVLMIADVSSKILAKHLIKDERKLFLRKKYFMHKTQKIYRNFETSCQKMKCWHCVALLRY